MKVFFRFVPWAFLLCFTSAHAEGLATAPHLLGEWGGARSSLAAKGIIFDLEYGSETAHNYSGGTRQLTEYTDQWVVGAGFDFEKMGFWHGGSAQITMTDRNGMNLGHEANIGNDMLLQEVYGRGQTVHLTDFWYKQKFIDDIVDIKFGRMTVGEDFASFSCDFQNLSFCGAQAGNLVGGYWLNWPTSVWAARLLLQTSKETYVKVGAYQDNPIYVSDVWAQAHGWALNYPSGTIGTLIPAEFAWMPKIHEHPGSYKFGAWYNTAKDAVLENPAESGAQFGFYVNFEQQLTGTVEDPALSVFLNATQADPTTAAVDRQISVGTQYRGVFGRRYDAAGLALASTNNNPRYANHLIATNMQITPVIGGENEYDGEIYYSFAPIRSIFLRPNLQYVLQPGGTAANKNAFVLGLKSGISF